jgi:hypothetical protein
MWSSHVRFLLLEATRSPPLDLHLASKQSNLRLFIDSKSLRKVSDQDYNVFISCCHIEIQSDFSRYLINHCLIAYLKAVCLGPPNLFPDYSA